MSRPVHRQQTNSQAQAGAASQVVVNLVFVTPDGVSWKVHPMVLVCDAEDAPPDRLVPAPGGASTAAVDVEGRRSSNAQGQALTVTNDLNLLEAIERALGQAQGSASTEPSNP